MAVTTRRASQLMPRLTHHNNAQLMKTGTRISSRNGFPFCVEDSTIAPEFGEVQRLTKTYGVCSLVPPNPPKIRCCGGWPVRANATIRSPPRARSHQYRDRARRDPHLQTV